MKIKIMDGIFNQKFFIRNFDVDFNGKLKLEKPLKFQPGPLSLKVFLP